MSSSSPQKLTFTSFKKEKVFAPQASPAPKISTASLNRLKFGFKCLFAFNIGLSVYMLFKEPPRRRNEVVAMVIDAAGPEPNVFPTSSMRSPVMKEDHLDTAI
ncbi:hypothetical protein V2J09_012343 [Rumex salicifolius]